MKAERISIDEDAARLLADTYFNINRLKQLLTRPEFTDLNEYINSHKTLGKRLNETLWQEDYKTFFTNLSQCIEYTQWLIEKPGEKNRMKPAFSGIHFLLTEILKNLRQLKNKISTPLS